MFGKLKKTIVCWLLKLIEKLDGKKMGKNDFLAALNAILSANDLSASDLMKNAALRSGEKGDLAGSLSGRAEELRKNAEAEYSRIMQQADKNRRESLREVGAIGEQAAEARRIKVAIDDAVKLFSD